VQPNSFEEKGNDGMSVGYELHRRRPYGGNVAAQPGGVQPHRLTVDAAVCQSPADPPNPAQTRLERGCGRQVGA